jgi:hypothetical protein
MTIEQYEKLKQYENLLYTSAERNYVMFGSIEVKRELSEIYTEIFGKKSNMLNSCGSCALREMKVLASEYYRLKKQLEEQQTVVEEQALQDVENKSKRGRKKKEEE